MIAAATFEIWLLGYNEACSNLLSHQLGRNPDYRLRRFSTIPLALASAHEGEQPEAIIFDCGPTPDGAVHRTARLLAYSFPGNVRELKAIVELAAVLADGPYIHAADLPLLLAPATGREASSPLAAATATGTMPSLREQTLAIMQNALLHTQGDAVAAASRLRIGRSTLYRLLQSGHLRLPHD